MMRALYKIGMTQKTIGTDALSDIVEPIAPGSYLVCLDLCTTQAGEIKLAREDKPFDYFETKQKDIGFIGLRSGLGKAGPNFTPVAIVTFDQNRDTPRSIRTFDRKILAFYKGYKATNKDIISVQQFFYYKGIEEKEITIELRRIFYQFMCERQRIIPKGEKRQFLLCIRIDGKLPGQRDEYAELLQGSLTEAIGKGRSEGTGNCCLSFAENKPVFGRASKDFPFYTIDKPGMITGGFREEFAWKNFAVSAEGAQGLKLAREYLGKSQKFYMPVNFRYWVIPKFVFQDDTNNLNEMLISLKTLSDRSPGFGLGYESSRDFGEMEEDIKLLGEDKFNKVLLTFLFYEPTNAQLKIRLAVDDMPPSRLRMLIVIQKKIAQLKSYNENIQISFTKSEKSDFGAPIRFSFGIVWSFFERKAQKGGESKFEADYLQFIRQLYLGIAPDQRHILRFILETLKALHCDPETKEPYLSYKSLQAMCWIRYLCELGLWKPELQNKGAIMKLDDLSIEPELKMRRSDGRFENSWMAAIETFYQEHSVMLDSPFLFGTFLLGSLIRLLMNVQAANLNSTPFEKELKGLRLKKDDVPLLFSKTIAKLRDYDQANTYKVLDELISDLCLREKPEINQITNEEVSAYFAFGLAQGRVFKKLIDLEKPKKNDDKPN